MSTLIGIYNLYYMYNMYIQCHVNLQKRIGKAFKTFFHQTGLLKFRILSIKGSIDMNYTHALTTLDNRSIIRVILAPVHGRGGGGG